MREWMTSSTAARSAPIKEARRSTGLTVGGREALSRRFVLIAACRLVLFAPFRGAGNSGQGMPEGFVARKRGLITGNSIERAPAHQQFRLPVLRPGGAQGCRNRCPGLRQPYERDGRQPWGA